MEGANAEYSAYERGSEYRQGSEGGIAIGWVTAVDSDNRLCDINTVYATDPRLRDIFVPKCQWLNTDAAPEGDESSSIPRVNSFCLVFFVEGQAFIWGFISTRNQTNGPGGAISEAVNSGDKVLKTLGENKIILRSGGEIEIQSTDVCRTIMLPDQHTIDTLCRRYSLKADGGYESWVSKNGSTLHFKEFRDTIARTQVIQEQKGSIDSTTILKETMGLGLPGGIPGADITPIFEKILLRTGELTIKIHPPLVDVGLTVNAKPTGEFSVKVGPTQFSLDVAATGETDISVNDVCKLNISPTGSFSVETAGGLGKLTMDNTGKVSVEASTGMEFKTDADINITANAGINIKSQAPVNIESTAPLSIKGTGGITLDGGPGASGQILLSPYALSDFTGKPIAPASNSLKGSP